MKNFIKLFGIITLIVIIGFSMAACDDGNEDNSENGGGGGGGSSTGLNVPGVGQLPAFPSGSTPAATKAAAEAVLAELRQSTVLESIEYEIWDVIDENIPNNSRGNYNINNRYLPNGYVRVNASETGSETSTGGFKALDDIWEVIDDLYDAISDLYQNYTENEAEILCLREEIQSLEEERYGIQFALNDRSNGTYTYKMKGELTSAKTEGDVTIAQGSTFEEQENGSENRTVTTAGTYKTFRFNETGYEKEQEVKAFTVTTSSGSVKVIFDASNEENWSGNNILYYDDDDIGTWTETETYSGSLKVYGSNNALLIDHRIVDRASYNTAYYMINYDPYPFNPTNATQLTSNTKVDGNITSPGTVDWYSINVTNGTKYHLWWDDSDTNNWDPNSGYIDVRVRGYTSDGYSLFDTDMGIEDNSGRYNYYSFTASSSGTVYIMVYPYNEYATGTYAIMYNTTGSQSAMSVSFIAPSGNTSARSVNKVETVTSLKKSTESMRKNRRGFFLNKDRR